MCYRRRVKDIEIAWISFLGCRPGLLDRLRDLAELVVAPRLSSSWSGGKLMLCWRSVLAAHVCTAIDHSSLTLVIRDKFYVLLLHFRSQNQSYDANAVGWRVRMFVKCLLCLFDTLRLSPF